MLTKGHTREALERFKGIVINQSRAMLTKKGKNVSKKLFNSIDGKVTANPNSFSLDFFMEDYAYYQDLGVKGAKSTYPLTLRYGTLAKFGSGKGKKGGLRNGILKWVQSKRFQFTDKGGRFMSYKSTAFLISRSIFNKGLKPSLFFTQPFQNAFKTLPDELIEAYGLDVEELLEFTLKR